MLQAVFTATIFCFFVIIFLTFLKRTAKMQNNFISFQQLMNAKKNTGFIYILTNPSYIGCVKIGKTARMPGYRAAELSSSSGVPTPFSVVYSRLVDNHSEIENKIHKALKDLRRSGDREFFDLDATKAKEQVEEIINARFCAEYDGTTYRQKQEAIWAIFFDWLKIPYDYYITEPIEVGEWMKFRPDFWLPEQDCYVVISQDLFGSDAGMMIAYCFAQKTKKVIVQLFDCEPGISYGGKVMTFHSGYYITPEGDYDGSIEWGICTKCNSTAILCDSEFWSPAQDNCGCLVSNEPMNPLLAYAYKSANSFLK